jgi:hypothetical protein
MNTMFTQKSRPHKRQQDHSEQDKGEHGVNERVKGAAAGMPLYLQGGQAPLAATSMASLAPAEKAPTGKHHKVGSPQESEGRVSDEVVDIMIASKKPAMPLGTACATGEAACGGVLRRQVGIGGIPETTAVGNHKNKESPSEGGMRRTFFKPLQAKLTIGQLNDVYEQQADRVADHVMSMTPPATPNIQQHAEEEEKEVQAKPLLASITPIVQRQEALEEDKSLQAMCESCEEEEQVQRSPNGAPKVQADLDNQLNDFCTEYLQRRVIQKKLSIGVTEDPLESEADSMADAIMHMPDKNFIQRKISQCNEEELQRKPLAPLIQRKESLAGTLASDATSNQMYLSKGNGSGIDSNTQTFMQSRFGADFSDVKIHAGNDSIQMNRELNAKAFTVGNDIYFNEGQYNPDSIEGLHLLAHELTHTIQQNSFKAIQRTPCIEQRTGNLNVYVIGSPSSAEIQSNHPYQFMNAAQYRGVDANTVWIVERTGYEQGGVDLSIIESSVSNGCLIWLTPSNPLYTILQREFPANSIRTMNFFSHGLAGSVTLRYGWSAAGLPNYGLSLSEVHNINSSRFAPNATIQFDSCNTGTDTEEGNLAQEFAYYSGRPVRAWTGRTSYSEVNDGSADGDTDVHGSQVYNHSLDLTEVGSRLRGRTPNLNTFSISGGTLVLDSDFEITTRLPESSHFSVSTGQNVTVAISNASYVRPNRATSPSDTMGVRLYKNVDYGFDDEIGHQSLSADHPDIAIFPRMATSGDYYLEITFESSPINPYETLMADIRVYTS